MRASLEALAQGASVGVVCKSLLGKAHTVMAEGGIAAAMANVDSADNWKTHFRDTMRGGKLLNNWRMAQLHAQESPDRVRELEQWGALFDRTESGDILQRAFGGHTFKRLCHVGDRTGLEMIRTLQDRGVQQGIDVYMECTVTRLLTDGGRITGAFAYWRETGRFIVFKAKSIVIATGGIGKAWRITSNSWEYTGDGMALAYEAGAELMDMEFVQFHPTGMVWPPGVQGILVTEAVRGEGGILRNKVGERFMEKYDPKRMELSTRDVVARVDLHRGQRRPRHRTRRRIPGHLSQRCRVREEKTPQHVSPVQGTRRRGHYQGSDGSGPHLPLRDGRHSRGRGNSAVHGARPIRGRRSRRRSSWRESPRWEFALGFIGLWPSRGACRCRVCQARPAASLDDSQIAQAEKELLAPFSNTGAESPYAVHRDLQEVMQNLVGIFRTEEDLKKALAELEKLKARAAKAGVEGSRLFNPGWHLSYDLKSMLTVSEAVAHSALARTESAARTAALIIRTRIRRGKRSKTSSPGNPER